MSKTLQRDERFMREALRLARKGRGRTSPNPTVGAVVVKRGRVIGRGYHRQAGMPHAEINALEQAGTRAQGGELFVNLEPCSHRGRTGPCSGAIVEAGLRRVVIGMVDPNPLVDGSGIDGLRAAGLQVDTGVLGAECAAENAAFALFIRVGRPLVTLKSAITLDGRVATRSGHARWVSGPAARRASHRLRNQLDAILVGAGTLAADDPSLTCRGVQGGRDPVRVVLDSQLRTRIDAKVVALAAADSAAPTWIVTTRRASAKRARALEARGVEILRVGSARGRVNLREALELLATRGIVSALVEGGPTLAGALWRDGLVDRVIAYLAPKLLADPQALPMIAGGVAETMDAATPLEHVVVRRLGTDIEISGWVRGHAGAGRSEED